MKPNDFPMNPMSPKSFGPGFGSEPLRHRKAFTKRLVRSQAVANAKNE
jgi:hypothetical protein